MNGVGHSSAGEAWSFTFEWNGHRYAFHDVTPVGHQASPDTPFAFVEVQDDLGSCIRAFVKRYPAGPQGEASTLESAPLLRSLAQFPSGKAPEGLPAVYALANGSYQDATVGLNANPERPAWFCVFGAMNGSTLDDCLLNRKLPAGSGANLARQLGEGLRVVHQRGHWHADLCTRNVFVTHEAGDGETYSLIDLDSCRAAQRLSQEEVTGLASHGDTGLWSNMEGYRDVDSMALNWLALTNLSFALAAMAYCLPFTPRVRQAWLQRVWKGRALEVLARIADPKAWRFLEGVKLWVCRGGSLPVERLNEFAVALHEGTFLIEAGYQERDRRLLGVVAPFVADNGGLSSSERELLEEEFKRMEFTSQELNESLRRVKQMLAGLSVDLPVPPEDSSAPKLSLSTKTVILRSATSSAGLPILNEGTSDATVRVVSAPDWCVVEWRRRTLAQGETALLRVSLNRRTLGSRTNADGELVLACDGVPTQEAIAVSVQLPPLRRSWRYMIMAMLLPLGVGCVAGLILVSVTWALLLPGTAPAVDSGAPIDDASGYTADADDRVALHDAGNSGPTATASVVPPEPLQRGLPGRSEIDMSTANRRTGPTAESLKATSTKGDPVDPGPARVRAPREKHRGPDVKRTRARARVQAKEQFHSRDDAPPRAQGNRPGKTTATSSQQAAPVVAPTSPKYEVIPAWRPPPSPVPTPKPPPRFLHPGEVP